MTLAYLRTAVAAVIVSGCLALAQDNPARKFTGAWEAKFNGTAFLVLQVHSNGEITGSMSHFNFEVDENGDLSSAEAAAGKSPMLRASVQDNRLTFEWVADANDDPLKFGLKLSGEQEAQLRLLATGEIKIKPFLLTRRD